MILGVEAQVLCARTTHDDPREAFPDLSEQDQHVHFILLSQPFSFPVYAY